MQLNDLRVNLTLDNDGFKITVKNSEQLLRAFEQKLDSTGTSVKRLENHFTSFGGRAHRAIMNLGMARFALMDLHDIFLKFPLSILKTSGEIERMTKLMEGLSKESDQAKRRLEAVSLVKFAFNMAQNAPFSVEAITDSMVKLKTAGIDPTNGSLKALINGIARFGGSSEQLHRASIAIQQMSGKGVISMEELRQQLGEAMPNAMQAMADGMNMTMAELTKAVSKGTVRSTLALKKMFVEMGIENAGAAAAMMETWTGMIEQLKTKWTMFQVAIADQGMAKSAKDALKELTDALGSDKGLEFGRDVGRALKTMTDGLITVTKKAIEFSDTIVTIGKLWALYWAAGKILGPIQAVIEGFKRLDAAIKTSADSAKTRVDNEQQMARQAVLSKAREVNAQIDANNQIIANERSSTVAKRTELASRLREEISTNEAIMRVHRQRVEEANRLDRQVAASPNVAAVRSGTASPAQDVEAQVLMRRADLARQNADLAERDLRLKDQQNYKMREQVRLIETSNGALSANALALQSQNGMLRQSVSTYEAQARAITAGNSAMAQIGGLARTAANAFIGFASSAMGLQIAIMLVTTALIAMDEKARAAARSLGAALVAKNKLAERSTESEDVESWKNANSQKNKTIKDNQSQIDMLDKPGINEGTKKRIQLLKDANKELKKQIEETDKDIAAGTAQVIEKGAERKASMYVAAAQVGEAKALDVLRTARNKLRADRDEKLKNANGSESEIKKINEQHKKDIQANSLAQLKERSVYLLAMADEYDKNAKSADFSYEKKKGYEEAAKKLRDEVYSAKEQADTRVAANDIGGTKGDGAGKKPKLDVVESALAREEAALLKLKNKLARMNGEIKTISEFKDQIDAEVDLMIKNDQGKKTYSKEERSRLTSVIIDKNLLAEEAKELRNLQRDLANLEAQQAQMDARAAGNVTAPAGNKNESVYVKNLREVASESVVAKEALKALQPWLDKIDGAAKKLDYSKFMEGEAKALKDLRVKNSEDAFAQIIADRDRDLQDLKDRYDEQIRMAEGHEDRITKLKAEHAAHRAEIEKAAAKKSEAPIDKLTNDWKNSTENMKQATAKWAKDGMDAIIELASGGKVNFRDMVTSMLKDLLRIHMQKSFGEGMAGITKGVGKFASDLLGFGKKEGAAAGDQGTGEAGILEGVSKAFKNLVFGSDQASAALGDNLTKATGDSVAGMVQQMVTGTTKMTAEQTATFSLQFLAANAEAAAYALAQVASSGGGGGGGSGIGSLFSSGSTEGMATTGTDGLSLEENPFAMSDFANGGIMTQYGSLALRKYANGGVATSPQLALFGEGSMNEAYVPLPDGRSIPVTVNGGGQGGGNSVVIQITVNEAEGGGGGEEQKSQGNGADVWQQMANRIKGVVQEEMVKQSRPGGLLYK